jgi:hypothetical protein
MTFEDVVSTSILLSAIPQPTPLYETAFNPFIEKPAVPPDVRFKSVSVFVAEPISTKLVFPVVLFENLISYNPLMRLRCCSRFEM